MLIFKKYYDLMTSIISLLLDQPSASITSILSNQQFDYKYLDNLINEVDKNRISIVDNKEFTDIKMISDRNQILIHIFNHLPEDSEGYFIYHHDENGDFHIESRSDQADRKSWKMVSYMKLPKVRYIIQDFCTDNEIALLFHDLTLVAMIPNHKTDLPSTSKLLNPNKTPEFPTKFGESNKLYDDARYSILSKANTFIKDGKIDGIQSNAISFRGKPVSGEYNVDSKIIELIPYVNGVKNGTYSYREKNTWWKPNSRNKITGEFTDGKRNGKWIYKNWIPQGSGLAKLPEWPNGNPGEVVEIIREVYFIDDHPFTKTEFEKLISSKLNSASSSNIIPDISSIITQHLM